MRRFLERLTSFGRLILFDSRGTGLSDRVARGLHARAGGATTRSPCSTPPAANARRCSPTPLGGLVGAMLAAEHPQRVGALIMYASVARTSWAPDYDWAMTSEQREAADGAQHRHAGASSTARCSRAWRRRWPATRRLATWFARTQRLAASPREARTIARATADLDVRDLLPRHPRADARHAPPQRAGVGRAPLAATWPSTSPAPATSSSRASTRSRSSATATRSSKRSRSSSPAGAAAASSRARC